MEQPPALIELQKRPTPERLRILADGLRPILPNLTDNTNDYCTVLGTVIILGMIADELEENEE